MAILIFSALARSRFFQSQITPSENGRHLRVTVGQPSIVSLRTEKSIQFPELVSEWAMVLFDSVTLRVNRALFTAKGNRAHHY